MGQFKKKIKKYLIDAEKQGKWIGRFGNSLIGRRREHRYNKFSGMPIDKKLIVFECFKGRKYTDSPRAIYEYLLGCDEYSSYRFAWCFRDSVMDVFRYVGENPRTELIRWGSEDYYRTYATAGYWFTNTRLPAAVGKREGQIYTQCWHGTPLKKLGLDITTEATESAEETKRAIFSDVRRYDYLISPSAYCSKKLSSAFGLKELGMEDVIIETGYPRNDSLSQCSPDRIKEIRERIGIPDGKKAVLYAPTYREDNLTDVGEYGYREPLDMEKLREDLGSEYVILFRTHYFIRDMENTDRYNDFIIDVSGWQEINELYMAADMLITDYSSVFFDYSVLKRPVVFFMYDLEYYRDSLRGLYLGTDELPGPVAADQEELTEMISTSDKWFHSEEWQKRISEFNDRFTYLDDGHASARAVHAVIR